MKGELQLQRFAQTLEEILRTIADKSPGGERLRKLRAENMRAFQELQALLGGADKLSEDERDALRPLVNDASRLISFAIRVAEADSDRVESELVKVHQAVRALEARKPADSSGASCDLSA